jgi:hypothetical protein
MNLHKRVLLSILSCHFVDEVLINAPGQTVMISAFFHNGEEQYAARYKYPQEIEVFTMIESPSNFKLGSSVKRIQKNQETIQTKV